MNIPDLIWCHNCKKPIETKGLKVFDEPEPEDKESSEFYVWVCMQDHAKCDCEAWLAPLPYVKTPTLEKWNNGVINELLRS